MSHINYLGGLHKEVHHIKKNDPGEITYEPTLVITSFRKLGKSFMIPLSAMWKYVEPHQYRHDERALLIDQEDFFKIAFESREILLGNVIGAMMGEIMHMPTPAEKDRATKKLAACQLAWAFSSGTGIMLCTSFNLFLLMEMFDISPLPQAAAQLLLWIQDGLDDLKNMPDIEPEKTNQVAGEATLFIGGEKISTKEMAFTETEILEQENWN